MASLNPRAVHVAEACVTADWTSEGLLERFRQVFRLRGAPAWLRKRAAAIPRHFPASPQRIVELANWLSNDSAFARRLAGVDLLSLPPPRMRPHAALSHVSLPALTSVGQIAEWLGLSPASLDGLAGVPVGEQKRNERARNYRYRWLSKPDGRRRLLEVPKPRLRAVQRRLHEELLACVPPHSASHGFVRGRSIKSFLEPHVARDWVLRLDLADFFTSIPAGRVLNIFRFLGYPEFPARLLTRLCVNRVPADVLTIATDEPGQASASMPLPSLQRQMLLSPHLPQGAPTSPALANLCLFRLDCRLHGAAALSRIRYTRYADDLVFSGAAPTRRDVPRFRMFILAILHDEGFSIRRCKSRLMVQGRSQTVCGLRLNERLNVPRATFDHLKAILHRCIHHGLTPVERDGLEGFRQHLRGRIAFVSAIHEQRGRKLMDLFDRIRWPQSETA